MPAYHIVNNHADMFATNILKELIKQCRYRVELDMGPLPSSAPLGVWPVLMTIKRRDNIATQPGQPGGGPGDVPRDSNAVSLLGQDMTQQSGGQSISPLQSMESGGGISLNAILPSSTVKLDTDLKLEASMQKAHQSAIARSTGANTIRRDAFLGDSKSDHRQQLEAARMNPSVRDAAELVRVRKRQTSQFRRITIRDLQTMLKTSALFKKMPFSFEGPLKVHIAAVNHAALVQKMIASSTVAGNSDSMGGGGVNNGGLNSVMMHKVDGQPIPFSVFGPSTNDPNLMRGMGGGSHLVGLNRQMAIGAANPALNAAAVVTQQQQQVQQHAILAAQQQQAQQQHAQQQQRYAAAAAQTYPSPLMNYQAQVAHAQAAAAANQQRAPQSVSTPQQSTAYPTSMMSHPYATAVTQQQQQQQHRAGMQGHPGAANAGGRGGAWNGSQAGAMGGGMGNMPMMQQQQQMYGGGAANMQQQQQQQAAYLYAQSMGMDPTAQWYQHQQTQR